MKVYVVVVVLFIAGVHVPVIPLIEVVGNVKVPPLHIGAMALNDGVINGFTVTIILKVVAHCPAAGVKVYVVVAVLFIAGLQVPVTPLDDVVGKVNVPPLQIGAIAANWVVTTGFTVTLLVAPCAHWPAFGVKV